MTGPYELGPVPKGLRRRSNAIATAAMVAIAAGLLMLVLLVEGVRPQPLTWLAVALVAVVVVTGLVLAVRSLTADDRASLELGQRRVLPPLPDEDDVGAPDEGDEDRSGADVTHIDLDDIDLDEIDLIRGPVVRVALRPGPLMRRRLADRPDALELVADRDALDVPGWLLVGRSRMIDRADRVLIPWTAVERFRVVADSDGPDIYDITARPEAGAPDRWRIRRHEIADEVAVLDHARRIGRITIVLEDSIRSE